jgi:hypothetical protein
MGIVKADITISADGYLAGPDQGLDHPFGIGGLRLFDWEVDDANSPGFQEGPTGAFVMGRNMSARSAASGTSRGPAGTRSRRTTHRYTCSPTTRATRCR